MPRRQQCRPGRISPEDQPIQRPGERLTEIVIYRHQANASSTIGIDHRAQQLVDLSGTDHRPDDSAAIVPRFGRSLARTCLVCLLKWGLWTFREAGLLFRRSGRLADLVRETDRGEWRASLLSSVGWQHSSDRQSDRSGRVGAARRSVRTVVVAVAVSGWLQVVGRISGGRRGPRATYSVEASCVSHGRQPGPTTEGVDESRCPRRRSVRGQINSLLHA
jgi:hypothetical protein